jgi:predicted GNAT family acetyltransferase
MTAPQDVTDNADESRFELTIDGHLAELVYEREGDRLVLVHTGVPEALGGQGLGGVLVQAALDDARARGLTVVPECPYAKSWIEKHPDAADGVTVTNP